MKPYLKLNNVPEGATHCFKPDSNHDPLFYRMVEGELQIWGMAISKWLVSKNDPDYIKHLEPLINPSCHWACTGCDTCGSKGHGNSWF
jgi:hypothetical protein